MKPRTLLRLVLFHAALLPALASGQSSSSTRMTSEGSHKLSDFAQCRYSSGLSTATIDRLPGRGLRYRTVETSGGTRRISMVDGYRIMLAHRSMNFAKLHVEESAASQYSSDKEATLQSLATLVTSSGSGGVSEQRSYEGFEIHGWNDPALEGDGPTGVYLLFRDSGHLIVTIYFFGKDQLARGHATIGEYQALRDGVVRDFATCARDPSSSKVATRAEELQPGTSFLLDTFDSVAQWRTNPSNGVEISIHEDNGRTGRSMRVDFDFRGHTGYGIVARPVDLELPANYRFEFAVRGSAPSNTLEFKLIDPSRSNVWWSRNPRFEFSPAWKTVTRLKNEICFAWGPAGGGEIRSAAGIEFAITAGSGGKGSIWIDDLSIGAIEPDSPFEVTAPVAGTPIVGTWESTPMRDSPVRRIAQFAADGSTTMTIGASTAFTYLVADNRLTTTIVNDAGKPANVRTSVIRIVRDTLFQQNAIGAPSDAPMRRVRQDSVDNSILGVWSFRDNSGAIAFVEFGRGGIGNFRAPISACSGTWSTSRGSLLLTLNGETAAFDYTILNGLLRMKDAQGGEGSYTRRRPRD